MWALCGMWGRTIKGSVGGTWESFEIFGE